MAASFKVPVYGGRVVVCTTREDYSEIWKQFEDEAADGLDEVDGLSSRHADKSGKSAYLVGWFDGETATLIHELVHTSFELLTHCEIPISKRNDEVFAYLMASLYEESIEALKGANADPAAV